MVTLPIPSRKSKEVICYMMQYDLNKEEYVNKKLSVSIFESQTMYDLRQKIYQKYGIDPSSYVITWVQFNQM